MFWAISNHEPRKRALHSYAKQNINRFQNRKRTANGMKLTKPMHVSNHLGACLFIGWQQDNNRKSPHSILYSQRVNTIPTVGRLTNKFSEEYSYHTLMMDQN